MKTIIDIIIDSLFDSNMIGSLGEAHTARKLGWINFLGLKGKILRNIYIPKGDGETSEIDLVYITKKGIFVIESKNYSGYVFGDEDNQYWTITLNAGHGKVIKEKLYNPIKQNKTHIKWLLNYLNEDIQTISLIVFSDRCELKKINYKPTNELSIFNRRDLAIAIGKRWLMLNDVLDENRIEEIYTKLESLTNVSEEIKSKHIQDIKNELNKCPKCGGKLIERNGKYGSFLGCSNYPKCKYTVNK